MNKNTNFNPRQIYLDRVMEELKKEGIKGVNALKCHKQTGMMRTTAERYLRYLREEGKIIEVPIGKAKVFMHPKSVINEMEEIMKNE
ncbi:MAG: hypothetical protein A7315_06870 [Candidatus Altiarchaeales archaeon WOR_SM1_79]|nr:MAG: hypothetical protein A7315_06870 [Candidatus Altiarchaeales archaeon WOR_SM1_79]